MGATVCTAGRFLLVAPLTNDEEEEEEEEAESVAPRQAGETCREKKKRQASKQHESSETEISVQDSNKGNVLMS